ncbi:hypothetical protein C1645_765520 [Glomus cerebriforme]|uniref:Uncharacterized protein n=1 Tax=Glomus cerebriforme TaxID=658196 RepID=A0A397T4Q7_9GLOM|nr:hypothetical protein C1645_765520 [Glomus cerebriforme]
MESINGDLGLNIENDTFDTTNPFYHLLEKQATEFELFGQRLKSEIQNSYREFQQQQQQQKIQKNQPIDTNPCEEIEKTSKGSSPSTDGPLVDSLKARIEELETDSLIKSQDIEKQKTEIQQLKQELSKNEIKKMKQEIEELNDFKTNFILLFESYEQMKSEIKELKTKLVQKDIENDRLFAERLQINENNNRLIAEQLQIDEDNKVKSRSMSPITTSTTSRTRAMTPTNSTIATECIINGVSDLSDDESQFSYNRQPLPALPAYSVNTPNLHQRSSLSRFSSISSLQPPKIPLTGGETTPFISQANSYTQSSVLPYNNNPYNDVFDNKIKRTNTFTSSSQNTQNTQNIQNSRSILKKTSRRNL